MHDHDHAPAAFRDSVFSIKHPFCLGVAHVLYSLDYKIFMLKPPSWWSLCIVKTHMRTCFITFVSTKLTISMISFILPPENIVLAHLHFCKLSVKLLFSLSLVKHIWIFNFHTNHTFTAKRSCNTQKCKTNQTRWWGHMNSVFLETTSFNKSHSHFSALTTFRRYFRESMVNLRAHIWWAWELLAFSLPWYDP